MKDKQVTELKQFFAYQLSQTEKRLERKIFAHVDSEIQTLHKEMQDGFAGVGDAIEGIYEYMDNRFIAKPRWLRAKL